MKKPELYIEIDNKAGFCFGVVKAISKAETNLNAHESIFCLGDIVHNEEEIRRLEKKGLKIISHDELAKLQHKKILFRAHGEPPESYKNAMKGNNEIIDATCQIIFSIQKKLRKSIENNENVYIFGKKNHPEIIGLNGQINNKAIIFEKKEDLDISVLPRKISLYSQTTKSIEEFHDIIEFLKKSGIEVKVFDTVCRQVANRRIDLLTFCKKFDVVIFVSGKNSSNGRVLFDICKQANSNSYLVSSKVEINPDWFNQVLSVGISGATSTPEWLMAEIKEYISSI